MTVRGSMLVLVLLGACGGARPAPADDAPIERSAPSATSQPEEGDGDGDRIADSVDQCPSEQETYNGHEDDDGCPDRRPVALHVHPGLEPRVYFAHGAAEPNKMANVILDSVAASMDEEQGARVVIRGYSADNESMPERLSIARAEAVREELLRRGVEPQRLSVEGMNDRPPVSDRKQSSSDRAAWRRVDFRVFYLKR
jgi:outer membrane protein OmpA-like peptidoglycan-associated protein